MYHALIESIGMENYHLDIRALGEKFLNTKLNFRKPLWIRPMNCAGVRDGGQKMQEYRYPRVIERGSCCQRFSECGQAMMLDMGNPFAASPRVPCRP